MFLAGSSGYSSEQIELFGEVFKILVAAIEVASVRWGNPLLSDVSPFLCLLVMLLIRPWGLFGTKEELERV